MPPATGSSAAPDRLIPHADARARFDAGLRAVWPEADDPRAPRLGIAVSGGPDSVALLFLAAAALPGRIEAATVDHGLRRENAQEAEAVASICGELGVVHATLPVSLAVGNVQSEARRARYAAMAEWAQARELVAISTGHHADDQAETLIMRLNRASGVAGLAGVRPRGPIPGTPIGLIRPLLEWRQAELGAIVAAAGIEPAHDPSNADDRFDRARLRKALAGAEWLDVAAIAQSAAHLADADAALAWSADLEFGARVKRDPFGMTYRPFAPRAIALRVVTRIVTELDEAPRGRAVARLFDALAAGQPASIGALVVRPNAGGWSFARAPARKAPRPAEQ
jgi:tRNA(Ile)-lysidine synthase